MVLQEETEEEAQDQETPIRPVCFLLMIMHIMNATSYPDIRSKVHQEFYPSNAKVLKKKNS